MRAVFTGPEARGVEIRGHGFNVKPAKFTQQNGRLSVEGEISRRRRLQPNDRMFYRLVINADRSFADVEINVQRGGFVGRLLDWFKDLPRPRPFPGTSSSSQGLSPSEELEALERALRAIEQQLSGKEWEEAAALIVANVMVRAEPISGGGARDRIQFLRRQVKRPPVNTRPWNRPLGHQGTVQIRDHRSR